MKIIKKLVCGVVCAAVALGAASAEAGVWLRFTFTKVRSVTQIQMSELAVYDKFGCRVNLTLTEAVSGTARNCWSRHREFRRQLQWVEDGQLRLYRQRRL